MDMQLYNMVELDETSSTQDEAAYRFRAQTRDPAPVLVVAARQTQGRGRSGASWDTAPRALAVSLAFRPVWEPARWPLITLTAGVAALRVLSDQPGMRLKWPNDLIRQDRKLGGILAEASPGLVVVGWGANLYWPDPPPGWGALFDQEPVSELGPRWARNWADNLLHLTGLPSQDWPRAEYLQGCATIGRQVTWLPTGRGQAIDVDQQGNLVVETAAGRTTLTAGEVREVRSAPPRS